jgi:hypothetical protein
LQVLVKPEDEVTVTRVDGTIAKGKIDQVETSTLRLLQDTIPVFVQESEIREIRKRDPIGNGTRLGAVVGGSVGLGLGILGALAFCGEFNCTPEAKAWTFVSAEFGAGVGAGVGLSLDAAFNRNAIVYRAPLPARGAHIHITPLLARGQKGFQLSVSF